MEKNNESSTQQFSRVLFIDPTTSPGGDGSFEHPFHSWDQVHLEPGDIALQQGGTTAKGFAVTAQGTADRPVIIGSYGTGQAKIAGSVVLSGASYVGIDNLDIVGGGGVVLTNATEHSTIRGCNIHGGSSGVVVTGSVGFGNVIVGNNIFENDTIGVHINPPEPCIGADVLVSDNTIFRNGQQGILIHSSHVVVDGNTVVNNGLAGLAGMSGIHVVALSAAQACHENVISNNIVAWQRDGSSLDGNGIQLDHWTFENIVVGNTIFGNDGCGINMLSTKDCLVADNLIFDNMVDEGGTHVIAKAEIFLGEANFTPGLTTGNVIEGNKVRASSPYGVAVQMHPVLTDRTSNVIVNNEIGRVGPGSLWLWGNTFGSSLDEWNSLRTDGTDRLLTGFEDPGIAFPPGHLERAVNWNSDFYRSHVSGYMNQAVPSAAQPDLFGSWDGTWMAGDGRENQLTAVSGDNQVAAGGGNAVLRGGPGRDSLFGGRGDNMIFAGSGDTVMFGGSGSSWLFGGSGNDIIYGGNGTGGHVMAGGGGENTLVATDGPDTFVLGGGTDVIYYFDPRSDRVDASAYGTERVEDLHASADAHFVTMSSPRGDGRAVLVGIDAGRAGEIQYVFDRSADTSVVSIEAGSAPRSEDAGGAEPFRFTLVRSGDSASTQTVDWTVRAIAGSDAPAPTASDFAGGGLPSGIVTFEPGETRKDLTIRTVADNEFEKDERFAVLLSAPKGGLTIGTSLASGLIRDDDSLISFARPQSRRSEGDQGTTRMTFAVERSGNLDQEVSAVWFVEGGGVAGTLAADAADFAGGVLPFGRVVFGPGVTEQVFSVEVAGDTRAEGNESFTVSLANTAGQASLGRASVAGVIWDDEGAGTGALSIRAMQSEVSEGSGGGGLTDVRFVVTRAGDISGGAAVDWAVGPGKAATLVSATDFVCGSMPAGRITFAPGETAATVFVYVAADKTAERDEPFTVTLSGPSAGVTIEGATATCLIRNDDAFESNPKDEAIRGFEVSDIFRLGGGIDTVTGGDGRDLFVFRQTALGDAIRSSTTITDFDHAIGETLDLSAIDAVSCTPENDVFDFIGSAPFSGTTGELRWQPGETELLIHGDTTGDGEADLTIWIKGPGPVEETWLVL